MSVWREASYRVWLGRARVAPASARNGTGGAFRVWRSQRRMPDGLVRFMGLVSVVRLFGEYVAIVGKREHGGSETVEGPSRPRRSFLEPVRSRSA